MKYHGYIAGVDLGRSYTPSDQASTILLRAMARMPKEGLQSELAAAVETGDLQRQEQLALQVVLHC